MTKLPPLETVCSKGINSHLDRKFVKKCYDIYAVFVEFFDSDIENIEPFIACMQYAKKLHLESFFYLTQENLVMWWGGKKPLKQKKRFKKLMLSYKSFFNSAANYLTFRCFLLNFPP